MIELRSVTFSYPGASPTLDRVDLEVPEGELCLVVGCSGSGKSTLLRTLNGLVPRFSGGTLWGEVRIAGRRTSDDPPRELADLVGYVGQDPAAGFVTDTVEDELAYVMENLGVEPAVMRRRVEDVLDLLSLHELRRRPLLSLSGGQQQRVAIGSVLTASPRVLVLDEPTSALDPASAEEVLAALARLVHDLGVTVVMAEHRLERVVQFADRVVVVSGDGGAVQAGPPATLLATSPVAPPVVELGRLLGWEPLPLSIREARRRARTLRGALEGAPAPDGGPPAGGEPAAAPLAVVDGLRAGYGPSTVLDGCDLVLRRGEVVALMGRNGSGKSTLLAHLAGLRPPWSGRVLVDGADPHLLPPATARRLLGFVPQDPMLLLSQQRVDDECAAADDEVAAVRGTTRALLGRLVGGIPGELHPRDLSEGQRLALALATILVAEPPLVLLDEPTRGLDYHAKARLGAALRDLAVAGRCVVLATHDVEVVAAVADRAVVLADGDVVADGAARDVVTQSPVFAPQVAKILAPHPLLTVAEVARTGAPGASDTSTVSW